MKSELHRVQKHMAWMARERIWPNGRRSLWTDAFGLVLLISLYLETEDKRYLASAHRLVRDVDRFLGCRVGYRSGESGDGDGQCFHHLAMWIYALGLYGRIDARYRRKAIDIAKAIHPKFVVPEVGVIWRMREDFQGTYPGYGIGALDAFYGYVVYRTLDSSELDLETQQMAQLVEQTWPSLQIDEDLRLGMMLWMTHFFPDEPWARHHKSKSLRTLRTMWANPPGYFYHRASGGTEKFAFSNFIVTLGLQAVQMWPEKVEQVHRYFDLTPQDGDVDHNEITHVMACASYFPNGFISSAAKLALCT